MLSKWCGAVLQLSSKKALLSPSKVLLYGTFTTSYKGACTLSPAEIYSMESLLLRRFYFLLLRSTLWNLYYWGSSTISCWSLLCGASTTFYWGNSTVFSLTNLNGQEILTAYQEDQTKKKWFNIFCFSSHSWSVKLDVRSNFIYNPDLYNYVIIYIMKISSTLFLYKEVFLSALDMPRSRPSSPTSRPAPNCQYSPDSLCHCIPYFIF